jgi:small conductance mechanosensitive channel
MRIITLFVTALIMTLAWPLPANEPDTTDPEIKVVNATQDQAIAQRLSAILAQIDGLADVEFRVNAGVLTLQGQVANAQLSREVVAIASRLEGVVYVQNLLQEELAVRSRLAPATEKFQQLLARAVQMLPLLLLALLAIVSFWLLGAWLARRSGWLRRLGISELATNLGMRFIRLLITGVGILIALELLDATALVSAALGVAGVIGIALGFAFRNIVENYLAGVLLSTRNPFAIGDQIQVGEFSGSVVRLTSRDTVLMTLDGNHLRIPNSDIITSAMTNFSRNPLRRFQFTVGVSVELDLVRVRQLGIATLTAMPGILPDPPPRCLIEELGDSAVVLKFFAWIDQRNSDFLKARSEAIRLVKTAFDQAGIEMPEPIYRIHMEEPDETDDTPVQTPSTTQTAAAAAQDVDVATDETMEQQLAQELRSSDEENLLAQPASRRPQNN